jgi:hypothetical protein
MSTVLAIKCGACGASNERSSSYCQRCANVFGAVSKVSVRRPNEMQDAYTRQRGVAQHKPAYSRWLIIVALLIAFVPVLFADPQMLVVSVPLAVTYFCWMASRK